MNRLLHRLFGRSAPPPPRVDPVEAAVASAPPDPSPTVPETTTALPDRPTPFAPSGAAPALFFMHIPKTSGSSTNRLLTGLYGTENVIIHAESVLPDLLARNRETLRVDGVSGHVPLCRWALYRGTGLYARATLLRDPWTRLVSHINWVNRFRLGEPLPTGKTGPATERVSAALADTDFSDRAALRRFFELVRAQEDFNAFDNMQVRMLVTGHHRATYKRLKKGDAEAAIDNLSAFAVVGFCEDQDRFRTDLESFVGQTFAEAEAPRENVTTTMALTPDNGLARKVFAPWIEMDQALYDAARALRG